MLKELHNLLKEHPVVIVLPPMFALTVQLAFAVVPTHVQ